MTAGRPRFSHLLLLLVALLGLVVLGVAIRAATRTYPLTGNTPTSLTVRGAFHVHTRASDGLGDLAEVARAAKSAGLRFVITTDHNLKTLPLPEYREGVLILPASELTTPWGHLVALGTSRALTVDERKADPIATVRQLGGLSFLAHPIQRKNPWTDWERGLHADGIELYSGDSFFRSALSRPLELVCAAFAYLGRRDHGLLSLAHHEPEGVEKVVHAWGTVPPLTVCALDAHGFPAYEDIFRTLSFALPDLVLSSDPQRAANQVVDGIRQGRSFCSFDALGGTDGFKLRGSAGETAILQPGQQVTLQLPPLGQAQARIILAGPARLESDGRTVTALKPGTLLMEVQLLAPRCGPGEEWRPWIVPSPIRIVASGPGG